MKKSLVVNVMALSLTIVMTGCAFSGYRQNNVEIYCSTQVSIENWQVKAHIVRSGEVSEDTIEKVTEIIQTKVPQEAWNFLANSGGKIFVVEGNNIKDYILDNYNVGKIDLDEDVAILGYCPYFYNNEKILQKVDVVIAADCLDSLQHEFYHVLDYSHEYSDNTEFQEIYKRADSIAPMIFNTDGECDYYTSNEKEFFAETAKRFSNGDFTGVDAELEQYFSEIFK